MNWMKKGPDLKLSDLRVPDFLYDLYYDLKERHLLPLVALLVVAMVAMPILLKNSSAKETSDPAPQSSPTATASSATGGDETLVVAKSAPGLRDYRRRLSKDHALDPFEQKGITSSSESSGGEKSSATEEGSSAATIPAEATVINEKPASTYTPVESTTPVEVSGGGAESSTGSASGGETRTRYASDAIDVRIVSVPSGSTENAAKRAKPTVSVRRNLPELTMLPTRATPAVTFMGTSRDGKKALLVVSSDVESIFGEASCVIGSQSCQLLALEPGLPETFVYGPHEKTYRIAVLKIHQTFSAKPRRATLGATKKKSHSQSPEQTGGTKPARRGAKEASSAG